MDIINAKEALSLFREDKIKNSNVIIDLIKSLQASKISTVSKGIAALRTIFLQLLQESSIKIPRKINDDLKTAKEIYQGWLYEQYNDFMEKLQSLMFHQSMQIKEQALLTYIELMKVEGIFLPSKKGNTNVTYPVTRHKILISTLLSRTCLFKSLIKKNLPEYFAFPDFLFHTLNVLCLLLKCKKKKKGKTYLENLFSFLDLITIIDEGKQPLEGFKNFLDPQDQELPEKDYNFKYSSKKAKLYFNGIWEEVLQWNLPRLYHKKCLVLLPERVMMHLSDPLQLTDFFINAYNKGGYSSILALHGVFVLISEYNMEYPDFYKKLYLLFEPSIFFEKHKARFFTLCNLFLSSPLLPEYYLAAFLKKICRLMLVAPSPCLIFLLKFVANLLVRFPSLQRLLHSSDSTCLDDDPYIDDESDPSLCKARESSLWEISTLRNHPLPGISKAANFIWRNLPDVEYNLAKYLTITPDDLFFKASKISIPEVEVVYMKPTALICHHDREISSEWESI